MRIGPRSPFVGVHSRNIAGAPMRFPLSHFQTLYTFRRGAKLLFNPENYPLLGCALRFEDLVGVNRSAKRGPGTTDDVDPATVTNGACFSPCSWHGE